MKSIYRGRALSTARLATLPKRPARFCRALVGACLFAIVPTPIPAQNVTDLVGIESRRAASPNDPTPILVSVLPGYYSSQDGLSSIQLIESASRSNGQLVATRLEIEKAKARLRQARLRANPTLEIEQTTGRLTGSAGENELSVGASLPLELFGRRRSRIDLAEIEITAREAEVANFERRLKTDVLDGYVEALAAMRELEGLESVLELDLQTTRFVQVRVNEGESAPLELNLLQTEVERLRSKRQLSEGRIQSALTRLKLLAGMPLDDPLRLSERLASATQVDIPPSLETAVEVALRTRPDLKLARIEEDLAAAGLRLVKSNSKPDVTAFTRYTQGRSSIDNTTIGPITDRDRTLSFGVSIGLPVFNRNQGAKAEAEIGIRQAQTKRDFAEKVVQSEVASAFQKYNAAVRALATLETGVLPRSQQNINVFRQTYQLGEIKITDLIGEQRRLLDANRDLVEALTERYRAMIELQQAMGVFFNK